MKSFDLDDCRGVAPTPEELMLHTMASCEIATQLSAEAKALLDETNRTLKTLQSTDNRLARYEATLQELSKPELIQKLHSAVKAAVDFAENDAQDIPARLLRQSAKTIGWVTAVCTVAIAALTGGALILLSAYPPIDDLQLRILFSKLEPVKPIIIRNSVWVPIEGDGQICKDREKIDCKRYGKLKFD